jgi:hypothetical protein
MDVDWDSMVFYTQPPMAARSSSKHQPSQNSSISRPNLTDWHSREDTLSHVQETINIEHGASQSLTSSSILDCHKGIPQPPLTMALANSARYVTGQ